MDDGVLTCSHYGVRISESGAALDFALYDSRNQDHVRLFEYQPVQSVGFKASGHRLAS